MTRQAKTKRAHSGRIEVRPAREHIQALKNTWRAAYDSACKHDGIEPNAKFAIFSSYNPFVKFADRASKMYFEAMAEYQAGGYIGLEIVGGRAR